MNTSQAERSSGLSQPAPDRLRSCGRKAGRAPSRQGMFRSSGVISSISSSNHALRIMPYIVSCACCHLPGSRVGSLRLHPVDEVRQDTGEGRDPDAGAHQQQHLELLRVAGDEGRGRSHVGFIPEPRAPSRSGAMGYGKFAHDNTESSRNRNPAVNRWAMQVRAGWHRQCNWETTRNHQRFADLCNRTIELTADSRQKTGERACATLSPGSAAPKQGVDCSRGIDQHLPVLGWR